MPDPATFWVGLGVVMLTLEAFGATGVGLVFGGLGALTVGALLQFGFVETRMLLVQATAWFGATGLWAVLLYFPLRRWRSKPVPAARHYSNIVGTSAQVGAGGLMLGKPGRVYWSGTMMNAQISPDSGKEAFMEKEWVTITDIRGNQLLVAPMEQAREAAGTAASADAATPPPAEADASGAEAGAEAEASDPEAKASPSEPSGTSEPARNEPKQSRKQRREKRRQAGLSAGEDTKAAQQHTGT